MNNEHPLSPVSPRSPRVNGSGSRTVPVPSPIGETHGVTAAATAAFLAKCSASTLALHADHGQRQTADVAAPLHLSTTFRYPEDPDELVPAAHGERPYPPPPTEHIYSRGSNSSGTRLEAVLSALLGAPALVYSSGLAAAHGAYILLRPRRVFISEAYHGVHAQLAILRRITGPGVFQELPLSEAAAQCGPGDVIHIETPMNPTGEARNLLPYAQIADERRAVLVVDTTFAPPPLQDPFARGAHIVLHSGSKYIGGHSDLLLGVLATRRPEWLATLANDRNELGGIAGSMEAWLAARSLRTLSVRVARQSQSAVRLVAWLHNALDPKAPIVDPHVTPLPESLTPAELSALRAVVARVQHSSVQAAASADDARWIAAQMPTGTGCPVFAITTTREHFARRLPGHLHLFAHATSLGGVESLIEWRAMSDANVDFCILRVSVGMEEPEDLWRDLVQACEALVKEKRAE